MAETNIAVPKVPADDGSMDKAMKKKIVRKAKPVEPKPEKSLASVTSEVKAKPAKVQEEGSRKKENHVFGLIITAVVILGVVAIAFGYVRDKIVKIEAGGTEPTKNLQAQVEALKNELTGLKEKTGELQEESDSNKSAVIDIFDKSREIPTNVNVTDWNQFADKDLGVTFSYPKTWEVIKPAATDKPEEAKSELVYLQPVGNVDFLNAITVKNDFADFAKLSLDDKKKIFKDMNVIDTQDMDGAAMIYFISAEKDSREVPTMVLLTADKIYKIALNITDKKATGYFDLRKDFEKIAATLAIAKPSAPTVEAEAPKE